MPDDKVWVRVRLTASQADALERAFADGRLAPLKIAEVRKVAPQAVSAQPELSTPVTSEPDDTNVRVEITIGLGIDLFSQYLVSPHTFLNVLTSLVEPEHSVEIVGPAITLDGPTITLSMAYTDAFQLTVGIKRIRRVAQAPPAQIISAIMDQHKVPRPDVLKSLAGIAAIKYIRTPANRLSTELIWREGRG